MRTPTSIRVALCVLALAAGGGAARADVPPGPDYHHVASSATIDFGAFARHATWRVETRAGDTLATLAERELGDAKRRDEIAALNPAVADGPLAERLKIVMPARDPAGKGPRGVGWWDLAYQGTGGGGPVMAHAERFYPDEPFPGTGGLRVFAIPHDRFVARATAADLGKDPAVAVSQDLGFGGYTKDSDPTVRIATRYRLELAGERDLRLAIVEQTRYDKDGRVVASAKGGPAPVPGAGGTLVTWIAGLVVVVALALLGLRRRDRTPAAPAA